MNNFNPTDIFKAVKSTISGFEVYPDRPKSKEQGQGFVVVKLRGNLEDLSAYGRGNILVSLFAKDVDNIINAEKLSVMQERVRNMIPPEIDYTTSNGPLSLLMDTEPSCLGDTPDDYGYHARMFNYEFIIKSL